MPTCFFIGHRESPDSLLPQLSAEVERHIVKFNVTDFVVGSYGHFDSLAAKTVRVAKKSHPKVTLTLLLPYHPHDRPVPIPGGFDGTFYPPGMETVPRRVAIVRANRYMVDHSSYLISCVWHPASNAWELVAYAKKREKRGLIQVTELQRPPDSPRSTKGDGNLKVELTNPTLCDKLHNLSVEYDLSEELLVNVAVKRLVDDVDFVRDLRIGKTERA